MGRVSPLIPGRGGLTLRESDDRGTTAPVLKPRRLCQGWGGSAFHGDVSVVLAVKKEKKRAPQALAGGRKGTGKD